MEGKGEQQEARTAAASHRCQDFCRPPPLRQLQAAQALRQQWGSQGVVCGSGLDCRRRWHHLSEGKVSHRFISSTCPTVCEMQFTPRVPRTTRVSVGCKQRRQLCSFLFLKKQIRERVKHWASFSKDIVSTTLKSTGHGLLTLAWQFEAPAIHTPWSPPLFTKTTKAVPKIVVGWRKLTIPHFSWSQSSWITVLSSRSLV